MKKTIETKEQLEEILNAMGELDDETKKSVVCSLVGHSDITEICFGYVNCARCGNQIGDTLGGYYPRAAKQVIVDHECDTCRENWQNMTWKDKYLVDYELKNKSDEEE